MDGKENEENCAEAERHRLCADTVAEDYYVIGKIRNIPEYIAEVVYIYKFLGIEVFVSIEKATP